MAGEERGALLLTPRALLPLLLLLGITVAQSPEVQQALITFRQGITNPEALGWNTAAQLCGQKGIECEGSSVVNLSLEGIGLAGTISSSLGSIGTLKGISLAMNSLHGAVPSELGLVLSLEWLRLGTNSLTGTIPSELGHLTKLKQIYLDQNSIEGTIPTELGNLESLIYMSMHGNSLSGQIPGELGRLGALTQLHLSDNSLSGTLPTELGSLTSLLLLYLQDNHIAGTIPTQFGGLSSLTDLFVHANSLIGTIPTELGSLTSLSKISFTNNRLTGTLPEVLDTLPLDGLYLAVNYFCPLADYRSWAGSSDYSDPGPCTGCGAPFETCLYGGTCTGGANTPFSCACVEGVNGTNCENNYNPCLLGTHSCTIDDSCIYLAGGGFECLCPGDMEWNGTSCACPQGYAWGSSSCIDVDECASGICGPNANCTNTAGSYACTCLQGYEIVDSVCVDVDECAMPGPVCGPNATCNNTAGSFSCTCAPGFTWDGALCKGGCFPSCHQNAVCNTTVGNFTCSCKPGFAGNGLQCRPLCPAENRTDVSWPATPVNETARGRCKSPDYGVYVQNVADFQSVVLRECLPTANPSVAQWAQDTFSCKATCAKLGCQNGGTCINSTSFALCECPVGFTGKFCEEEGVQRCPDVPCVNGVCVNPPNLNQPGYCECSGTDFEGTFCQAQIDDCDPNPCFNLGDCTDGVRYFSCECRAGFLGKRCQTCNPDECQNGGRCQIAGEANITCNCQDTGHMGDACALPVPSDCRARECENGGVCQWSSTEVMTAL